jgi:hypothetical protein
MHFFAHLLGVKTLWSEINIAESLWTTCVTSHVPLKDVAHLVTLDGICAAIDQQLNAELEKSFRISAVLVGAAGLEPATLCLEVSDSCPILLILLDTHVDFSGGFVFLRRLLNNSLHNVFL